SSLRRQLPSRSVSLPTSFFFNTTTTTEISTLSLHDALPISQARRAPFPAQPFDSRRLRVPRPRHLAADHQADEVPVLHHRALARSEEHTSELQSRENLVCRLLLEKKKDMRCNDKCNRT